MKEQYVVSYRGNPVATYRFWTEALEACRLEGFHDTTVEQVTVGDDGKVIDRVLITAHDARCDYDRMGE